MLAYTVEPLNKESPQQWNFHSNGEIWQPWQMSIEINTFSPSQLRLPAISGFAGLTLVIMWSPTSQCAHVWTAIYTSLNIVPQLKWCDRSGSYIPPTWLVPTDGPFGSEAKARILLQRTHLCHQGHWCRRTSTSSSKTFFKYSSNIPRAAQSSWD